MKLAVNTLIFGLNQAVAEGLSLAEAAGIDRAAAYDVLAASAVGAPYVGYKRAAFLEPETTPVAFSLDLAAKDLRLIAALAEAVGVDDAAGRARTCRHRIGRRGGRRRPRLLGRPIHAADRRREQRRTGLTDHLAGAGRPVERAHAIVEAAQRRPQ